MVRETELYLPVKEYLEERGYTVRGEVRSCDLAAVRGGELVLVELKMAFNLELVLQGNERKRIAAAVFLAVPRPKNCASARWRKILRLCRALGLGLLTVSPRGLVEAACLPARQAPPRIAGERERLEKEFGARTGDHNLGGSRGRPLVTAYRERALAIARCLAEGELPLGEILAATGIGNAASLLQKNHYGWFERVRRGVYCLSPGGRQALEDYADVLPRLG